MIYVDDDYYGPQYFERCFARFERLELLRRCERTRIAVCVADGAFWLALCLYVKARGGSVYPLSPDMPLEAARRRAQRSGCEHLVFGRDGEAALAGVEHIAADARSAIQEAALIQTSSGTTGEPKFIARSWASIDMEVESYVAHFDASALTPIVACPINHSYGLISGVLVALRRGVTPIVVTNPNPKYLLRKLSASAAPLLYASPPLIASVTALASAPLHAIMTSGTLLPKTLFESVRGKVRHLHQQYGCSEAGCLSLGQDIGAASELGTPLPHVQLSAGESAQAPREIVAELHGARAVETRDLGYFERGKLHFVARADDMINVAGLNVYPSEVEEVVLAMPGVTDAVAFKRSRGLGNDQVCLQLVADHALAPSDVRAWCGAKLARHQVPMSIEQVPSIPRLPNGKVSRTALAATSDRGQAS